MRERKNISSHPVACSPPSARCFLSRCFIFIYFLLFPLVVAAMVVLSRRSFSGTGPEGRKRRGNNSRVHSRKRNSGENGSASLSVGRRRARARASSVNNRPKKRRGGRIICWTPGRERLIAALCLRDTREFCNCDDRGRAE